MEHLFYKKKKEGTIEVPTEKSRPFHSVNRSSVREKLIDNLAKSIRLSPSWEATEVLTTRIVSI